MCVDALGHKGLLGEGSTSGWGSEGRICSRACILSGVSRMVRIRYSEMDRDDTLTEEIPRSTGEKV